MRPNGQAIRDRRQQRGESIEQVAVRARIGTETLRNIEVGNTEDARPLTMIAIAKALGTDVNSITGDATAVSA